MLLKFQSRRLTDPPGLEVGWGCAEEAVSLRISVFRATSETHRQGWSRLCDRWTDVYPSSSEQPESSS